MSIERVLRLAGFALLLPLTAFAHDSRVAPAATTVVIDGATLETITNGRIENGRIRIEAGRSIPDSLPRTAYWVWSKWKPCAPPSIKRRSA